MKLYTRSEIIKMLDFFQVNDDTIVQFIDKLEPIELPTDEEIWRAAYSDESTGIEGTFEQGIISGAKWVINKIKGGKNE